jgi:hypothetical protein
MVENQSSDIKPITLRISYSAADLVDAARIYQRTTPLHVVIRLTSICGLLIVACWLAFLALDFFVLTNLFGEEFRLNLFASDLHFLVWILPALALLSVLSWFRPLRPLAVWLNFQRNKAHYQGSYQVTLDGQGVLVSTSNAESRQYWSAFTTVLESEMSFLLVYGPWEYAVLPKREFTSTEFIEQTRNLIREKIGKHEMV